MDRTSISFVILILILGMLIGSVGGSLIQQVFGYEFLNRALPERPLVLIENFYLVHRLELVLTPGALLGLVISGIYLYKKGKG